MRWVSERYVAPLAAVIGRGAPPRVASEEGWPGADARRGGGGGRAPLAQPSHAPLRAAPAADSTPASSTDLFSSYRNGDALRRPSRRVPARSSFGRHRRTRSRPPSRPSVGCLTVGGARSCWCPRRRRFRRPRRRSSTRSGSVWGCSSGETGELDIGGGWRSWQGDTTSSWERGRACSPRFRISG